MVNSGTGSPVIASLQAAITAAMYDFASAGPQQLTGFSRASPGSFVNSSGGVTFVGNDSPRIDYSGASPTLLVEAAATNFFPTSNTFAANTNSVVTNANAVAPDGTTTAATAVFSAAGSVLSSFYITPVSLGQYVMSVWLKATASGSYSVNWVYVNSGQHSGSGAVTVTTNWQRFYIALPSTIPSGSTNMRLQINSPAGTPTAYLWGSQLELAATPTSLIQTSGVAATRAADVPVYSATTGPALTMTPAGAGAMTNQASAAASFGAFNAAETTSEVNNASAQPALPPFSAAAVTGVTIAGAAYLAAFTALGITTPLVQLIAAPVLGALQVSATAGVIGRLSAALSLGAFTASGITAGAVNTAHGSAIFGLFQAGETIIERNYGVAAPVLGVLIGGAGVSSYRTATAAVLYSPLSAAGAATTNQSNPISAFPVKIAEKRQDPSLGEIVDLFTLDMTNSGGPLLRWVSGSYLDLPVSFGGLQYQPLPIQLTGLEWTTKGAIPQPKLSVSNISGNTAGYATALVIAYGDLVGAIVMRTRTYSMFLDGRPYADSTASEDPAIYRVNRKSSHRKDMLEFELASVLDQQGRMLPGRQVIRDACTHTYRTWTGTMFVAGSCPYTGSNYYDQNGNAVSDPSLDVCGFRLGDCLLRFAPAPLPTRAFPGCARTQVS